MIEEFDQLYPTPPELVTHMIEPFTREIWHGKNYWGRRWNINQYTNILDPQAGKGDLLEAAKNQVQTTTDCYAIEIDPLLRLALHTKGIKTVDTDLLAMSEFPHHYGLILSNPPFNRGCQHALHIWKLMAPGADLCIVLNAETIRNPFTDERQLLLNLIEDHGWTEEIGQPFKNAERPTDVECCLVYLHKPDSQTIDWDAAAFETEERPPVAFTEPNALANRNTIALYVHAYQKAQAAQAAMELAAKERAYWLKGISKPYEEGKPSDIKDAADITAGFWNVIFEATQIGRRTTTRFQSEFKAHLAANKTLAFNERNIQHILEMFIENSNAMLEQAIDDAFEMTIAYHEDNRLHVQGWKTNDSYRCTRRFIIPYGPNYDKKWDKFNNMWCYRNNLTDLDRALCFITGLDIQHVQTSVDAVYRHTEAYNHERGWKRPPHDRQFSSTFFDPIRIFKKGTIHLTFEDERLWMQFNLRAARNKGWLPNRQKSPPKQRRPRQEPIIDHADRTFYHVTGDYEWIDQAGQAHIIPVSQTVRDEDPTAAFYDALDWAILETTPDFHHRYATDNTTQLAIDYANPEQAKQLTGINWDDYLPALPAPQQPSLFLEETNE